MHHRREAAPQTPATDIASQHTWKHASFARQLLELATTDLDHDGKRESVVYELWANDYGLDVFVEGTAKPIHGFTCGNI